MFQRDNTQVESIAIYNQEGVVKQSQTGAVPQVGRISSPQSPQLHRIITAKAEDNGKSPAACMVYLNVKQRGKHVVHYSWGFSYSLDIPQSNLVPLVWTVAMNIYNRCSVFKHASEYIASSKCQVNSTDSYSELGHGSLFFSFFLPNCHFILFFWSLFQFMLMAQCFVPNNENGQNGRQAQWLWY